MGEEEGDKGRKLGSGAVGGQCSGALPPLPFNLKCGDTSTGSFSIGVKFEDKTTLIGRC